MAQKVEEGQMNDLQPELSFPICHFRAGLVSRLSLIVNTSVLLCLSTTRQTSLTGDLKEVGEKHNGLCSSAPVRPHAKERARQQAAQAEGRQAQTQEVRRRLQDLEVPPYCGQDNS